MNAIKIFLVDDHNMVRVGLKLFLEEQEGIEIVGEAENGLDCLEKLKSVSPDIVVTDMNMPKMNGLELTKALKANYPDIKVVALTMMDDQRHIKQLLAEGASSYLLKDCEEAELLLAIKTVFKGDVYYSPEVTAIIMNSIRKVQPRDNKVVTNIKISEREKEVLHLILKEYSNQEIGDELFISPRTVEVHKRNLLEKTGSKNLAGLILYAIDANLFDDV